MKLITATVGLFLVSSAMVLRVGSMPPAQCDPELIEDAPYQLRKVCAALSTIYELSNAMESYIEEKSPRNIPHLPAYLHNPANERFDNGVKRQDLDHVFLRFGRRRR